MAPAPLRPKLGLVCVTFGDAVRFRTITRTHYLRLTPAQRRDRLDSIYRDNLHTLFGALEFCRQRRIALYRMSSSMFPFSDMTLGRRLLDAMGPQMAGFGRRAAELGIRVVMHPDQFVVLSSDTPRVVRTSIGILEKHGRTMDLLGLPRSVWSAMILHGGKADRHDALLQAIALLPPCVRYRLALENDEYAYSAAEILAVCRAAAPPIPMVFDAHHHAVHEKLASYDDPSVRTMVLAARTTWPDPAWQIVHLTNGRDRFLDPRHSTLIRTVPDAYADVPWIEVEAKGKEDAIAALRREACFD